MPFKSKAQEAWAHTPEGVKALGNKVSEWDSASKGLNLPEHVKKLETMKKAAEGK